MKLAKSDSLPPVSTKKLPNLHTDKSEHHMNSVFSTVREHTSLSCFEEQCSSIVKDLDETASDSIQLLHRNHIITKTDGAVKQSEFKKHE